MAIVWGFESSPLFLSSLHLLCLFIFLSLLYFFYSNIVVFFFVWFVLIRIFIHTNKKILKIIFFYFYLILNLFVDLIFWCSFYYVIYWNFLTIFFISWIVCFVMLLIFNLFYIYIFLRPFNVYICMYACMKRELFILRVSMRCYSSS